MQSESRQYVFARDEWGYYCVLFPSDVQSLDPTVNSFMENVRQNELDGILDDFKFVLAQHYARTPGSNATCLGCGYVGNISIGLMSMGDKLS